MEGIRELWVLLPRLLLPSQKLLLSPTLRPHTHHPNPRSIEHFSVKDATTHSGLGNKHREPLVHLPPHPVTREPPAPLTAAKRRWLQSRAWRRREPAPSSC